MTIDGQIQVYFVEKCCPF